jgi:hypothetical protein
VTPWVEPTTDWHPVVDDTVIASWLMPDSERFHTWPAAPFERTPTYCYRRVSKGHTAVHHVNPEFCIWQPEVGAARFSAAVPHLTLHPLPHTDRASFALTVWRSWLPAIYPLWGRQVLHASAVALATGDVFAFTGSTGAGKSTLAYGLSRREGWRPVADDTLVFSSAPTIALHPLRLQARLRAETAAHYGLPAAVEEPFEWPGESMTLRAIYVLDGHDRDDAVEIARMGAGDGYRRLLAQAHAMSLAFPEHNQRLMREYLTLAGSVVLFTLSFPKSFARFDAVLEAVHTHATRETWRSAAHEATA